MPWRWRISCGWPMYSLRFRTQDKWAGTTRLAAEGYLRLENGIPSHDTFGRLFGLIDPDEFETAFRRWVSAIVPRLGADTVVAIDGKTSRRSGKADAKPLHLAVPLWPAQGWFSGSERPLRNQTRRRRFRSCWRLWHGRVVSSRLMR